MSDFSADQRREIEEHLQDARLRKLDPVEIIRPYNHWCSTHKKEPVDREVIRLWYRKERRPTKYNNFYEYVNFTNLFKSDDPERLIARAVNSLFPSGQSDDLKKLSRLQGHYRITRRDWTIEDESFIQYSVHIYQSKNVTFYLEDEIFNSSYPVDERYKGYAFLFGGSIWIIAHEAENSCIKFLTIHDCTPTMLTGSGNIQSCRGNLIAVNGRGPNYSHRFVLHRLKEKMLSSRTRSRDQVSVDFKLDRLSYDYLCN